ncbi:ABC transporter ATP-binding protein [Helcococcus sueciensis]|uniref:ABC transporter ATP-binding protein n=1 Tax=Helcococcus sueciensis TaxID=241555 RepID=UPI000429429D|nr:ABC transporter ATP-binding protein [Helcococcus sueciensis]
MQKQDKKRVNIFKSFAKNIAQIKEYKGLLIIALSLAIVSAILTTSAPNQLSKLTDEISSSLNIDNKKMEDLSKVIFSNLQLEKPGEIEYKGTKITLENQQKYLEVMKKFQDVDKDNIDKSDVPEEQQQELLDIYRELPEDITEIIEPKINLDKIWKIATIIALIYILSMIANFVSAILISEIVNNYANKLRNNVSNKMNKLPLNYFDQNKVGDILSRMTNDVDTIAQSLNDSIGSITISIALLIGSVVMMIYTNILLTIVAVLSSLLGFLATGLILSKSQKFFTERQKQLGNLNGHIEEMVSGLEIIKVYNAKDESMNTFNDLNDKFYDASLKSKFLSGLIPPLMTFIGNFGYLAVSIVGAILATKDIITFGVIVAFMIYVRTFTNSLTSMAQVSSSIQSSSAASDRVFEFLEEKELPKEENMKYLDPIKVKGEIEFEEVVFQYPTNDKPTIKGFSAKALPGQKIAIVGPTGAGKSTMVNLLMKFYEISDGDIKIDGVSIKDISRENIHQLFTMILQDTWLFHGTIRENIVYNMENINDSELKTLAQFIGLEHFIKTLPEGFDTVIKDSDSVSAGQRQLLTIARGMLKNAPFLILDEATSNVDTRTEEVIQEAMDKLMVGKTSFIIAHRLSTIINSDLILVMNEGNIIEQGTHEELLDKNGFYAELYNSQFSLD